MWRKIILSLARRLDKDHMSMPPFGWNRTNWNFSYQRERGWRRLTSSRAVYEWVMESDCVFREDLFKDANEFACQRFDWCAWEEIFENFLIEFSLFSGTRRSVMRFSLSFTRTPYWTRNSRGMKLASGHWVNSSRRAWWLFRRIRESLNPSKALSTDWISASVKSKRCCSMWVFVAHQNLS